MNDIAAALGISQLKSLKHFLKSRNKIAKFYDKKLYSYKLFLPKDKTIKNAFHLYPIRTKGKNKRITRLKAI